MMNTYHAFTRWLLAVTLLLGTAPFSRAQTWTPASPVTVCPGETGTYTLSGIPAGSRVISGQNIGFVTGGTITNSPSLNGGSVAYTVRWDDTPSGGKLTANIEVPASYNSNGTVATYRNIDRALVAQIRSVAGQPAPGGSISIPVCSTSPFTLNVPVEYFVNVPNEAIPAYLWEVPASWGVQGATQIPSFGTTPNNFNLYQGTRTITLTPTPGGTVDLRVFQYSSICNQTYNASRPYMLLSFPGLFRVVRDPGVAITSGPTVLYCGDRTPVTFTAQANQSQGVSFNWTYPSGWTVQGSANGTSIVLIPNGSSGGPIAVQALYSCGGPSVVAVATSPDRQVTVRPEVAPIAILPIPSSCPGQTIRVQATTVAGATSYAWNVPYPFSPQGITSTTMPYRDITSDATAFNRAFRIKVQAFSTGCTPSYAERTGILGTGSGISISSDAPHSQTEICPFTSMTLQANIDDDRFSASTTYTYDWTITQRNGRTGATSSYSQSAQTIFVTSPGVGDWLDVRVRVRSSCGDFYPSDQSWQSVDQFQSGEYCLLSRPAIGKSAATAAYPNPADERLQLPAAASSYTLYDGYGRAVRTGQSAGVVDTRNLPGGLYYLVHQDAAGRAVRQAIEVRH